MEMAWNGNIGIICGKGLYCTEREVDMTIDDVTAVASTAIFTIIKCAAPLLLVSLCVGLIVSIFQTITSIQEQTLTFVPKILAVFAVMLLVGAWMLNNMSGFMVQLWSDFSKYV